MQTLEVLDKVLKGKRLKPSTIVNYRNALKLLAAYSPEWPVSGVVINEWLAQLSEFSDGTVKTRFSFVKAAARYMKKAYKLDNPFEEGLVETPKVANKKRRYFSIDEVVKIAQACKTEFEQVLIAALLDSGCRIGEMASIKPENIGESWVMLTGKTGERKYRMDPVLCERMRVMSKGGKPVFPGRSGEACSTEALKRRATRIVIRAGIKGDKLGPHTFRHTAASLVARETGSGLAVKALLQHDNIDTSMIYIHDTEDELAQKISPLKLVGEKFRKEQAERGREVGARQIGFDDEPVDSTALVPIGVVVADETDYDLESALYPEVADGVGIRPLLKTEDVRLLRRICVWYERNGESSSDKVRARDLLKRMLRKSGK